MKRILFLVLALGSVSSAFGTYTPHKNAAWTDLAVGVTKSGANNMFPTTEPRSTMTLHKDSYSQYTFSMSWVGSNGDGVEYVGWTLATTTGPTGEYVATVTSGPPYTTVAGTVPSPIVFSSLVADQWYVIFLRVAALGDVRDEMYYFKAGVDPTPPDSDGTGDVSATRYNRFIVTCPWPYPSGGDTSAISKVLFRIQPFDVEGNLVEAAVSTFEGRWSPAFGGQWQATLTTHGEPLVFPSFIVSITLFKSAGVTPSGVEGYDFKFEGSATLAPHVDFGTSSWKYTKAEYLNHAPEVLKGIPDGASVALPTELLRSQNNSSTVGGGIAPEQIGDVPTPATATAAATSGDVASGSQAVVDAIKTLDSHVQGLATSTGSGTDMTDTNAKLDGLETKAQRDAKITAGETAASTLGSSEGSAAEGKLNSSKSAATSVANSMNTTGMLATAKGLSGTLPVPSDNAASSTSSVVANTGGGIVSQMVIDTNPFTSTLVASFLGAGTLSAWAAWCRNAVVWLITVGFIGYVTYHVKENLFHIGQVQPAPLTGSTQIVLQSSVLGNSVGVPAALGVRVVIQVVISTFFLALPVLIVADLSTAANATSLLSSAYTAATAGNTVSSSSVLSALSYTNRFLPLVLICTVAVNRVLVNIAGVTQWVIYMVGMKLAPL